jgi:hypothetical protein
VLYSRKDGRAEISACHIQSLGTLFNELERKHSAAINERQDLRSQIQAITSSKTFQVAKALATLYVKLSRIVPWNSRKK